VTRSQEKKYLRSGNRVWRSSSVRSLVEEYGKPASPEEIIKHKARLIVEQAVSVGWTGPPFDPLRLASILGIRANPSPETFAHEAMIIALPDGQLEIRFHPNRTKGRKNYSVRHEISHTFFPDSYEIIQFRSKRKNLPNADQEVEMLCEIGASHLLMPEPFFSRDLIRVGLSFEGIGTLRQLYAASWEAVIRRAVSASAEPVVAVFLELKNKPSELRQLKLNFGQRDHIPEKKLRVQYTVSSRVIDIFVPKDKSIPSDSCVYRALTEEMVFDAVENWNVGGIKGCCRVEAFPVPPKDFEEDIPRVVALVRFQVT
jgi:hypothetical protein